MYSCDDEISSAGPRLARNFTFRGAETRVKREREGGREGGKERERERNREREMEREWEREKPPCEFPRSALLAKEVSA